MLSVSRGVEFVCFDYINLKNTLPVVPNLHDIVVMNGFQYTSDEIQRTESNLVCKNVGCAFPILEESSLEIQTRGKTSQGEYGKVYFVGHSKSQFPVVYKKYTSSQSCGLDISSIREITVLSIISHPNIVKMDGIVINDSIISGILLEKGKCDVKEYLTTQKFTKEEFLNSVTGLAKAIEYIHNLGISHCDIKPDNIIVFGRNTLKLTDWGLGVSGKFKRIGDVCAVGYRPPELLGITGAISDVDCSKVDIWSFGCVVWFLWNSKRIFLGSTEENVLKSMKLLKCRGLFDNIPKKARKLVKRALVMNPKSRVLYTKSLYKSSINTK